MAKKANSDEIIESQQPPEESAPEGLGGSYVVGTDGIRRQVEKTDGGSRRDKGVETSVDQSQE